MVDHLVPGSFNVSGTSDLDAPLSWKELLFFSFTTLTSTGYGRIIPTDGHAQSLAILEQLAGVFFVAILIARLAGLYQPGALRRSTWRIERDRWYRSARAERTRQAKASSRGGPTGAE